MTLFIDRRAELSKARDLLLTTKMGVVVEVCGIEGVGKTTYLNQLRAEMENDREAIEGLRIFNLDLSLHELGESFTGDYGPNASLAVLRETFTHAKILMLDFYQLTGRPREFQVFWEKCQHEASHLGEILAMNTQSRSAANIAEGIAKDAIRQAQTVIDNAFIEGWNEWVKRRRVLITLDGFEHVVNNELGQWLARISQRLQRTLAVISRVPTDHTFPVSPNRFHRWLLRYFTHQEIQEYFDHVFGEGAVDSGVVDATYEFTGGHPGGVMLTTKYINEKGIENLKAADLRRELGRLSDDPSDRWAELVDLILKVVRDPLLFDAVDACAVVNSFDAKLLSELLVENEDARRNVSNAISTLKGYGIIEEIPATSRDPSIRFRLYGFIRQSLNRKLRMNQPKLEKLHRLAALHYFRALQDLEEDSTGIYSSWYRYEKPEWQECKSEWLYHSGQFWENPEMTRARFALVFFEAFWWWGYYHPFEVNRRLLTDWDRRPMGTAAGVRRGGRSRQKDDEDLGEALAYILDNYPMGYLKHNAPWGEIRSKLLLVQRLCGLGRGSHIVPDEDPNSLREEHRERAQVAAIIKIFLAHTWRFQDVQNTNADRYYDEAATAFELLKDHWTVAWLLYERADLALERRHADSTVNLIRSAAALLRQLATESQDWDYELLANLHRVRADVHWLLGQIPDAIKEYGLAVSHAYHFQGVRVPDGYTQRFYDEMTTRAGERLRELWRRGAEQDALHFAAELRRCLPGVEEVTEDNLRRELAHGEVTRLRRLLFPRGPESHELGMNASSFIRDWMIFAEDAPDTIDDVMALITSCSVMED